MCALVFVFFVSEMVISIGGCKYKECVYIEDVVHACIESLALRFPSHSGRVRFNSFIHFSISISVSVSMYAFGIFFVRCCFC